MVEAFSLETKKKKVTPKLDVEALVCNSNTQETQETIAGALL